MNLLQILILALIALAVGLFPAGRRWSLLLLSGLAVYALQPALPIRGLNYWLPSLSLTLCIGVWVITHPPEQPLDKEDRLTLLLLGALVLSVGLNRYLAPLCCLTATLPPPAMQIAAGLALIGLGLLLAWRLRRYNRSSWYLLFFTILVLFILLKSPALSSIAGAGLRSLAGQSPSLAQAGQIQWLGFSYLAFRLIHVMRDRLAGRLTGVTLRQMITYAVFFPALPAGPIDRIQHFIQEEQTAFRLDWLSFTNAGGRFLWGVFKKFVLADSLALIALNDPIVRQLQSQTWSWILLYAYAWRIFWDFSGYTDIAVGLGQWMGFHLPENFNRPYFQANLTQFWNSWHITLAQWFRAYFFNPLTRWMRTQTGFLPTWLMIFTAQLSTMVLIGLWHGLTWNFALWGLWHGIGLFLHNRWNSLIQPRLAGIEAHPWGKRIGSLAGGILTFHYVTLGWVWFALGEPAASLRLLNLLLGIHPGN